MFVCTCIGLVRVVVLSSFAGEGVQKHFKIPEYASGLHFVFLIALGKFQILFFFILFFFLLSWEGGRGYHFNLSYVIKEPIYLALKANISNIAFNAAFLLY